MKIVKGWAYPDIDEFMSGEMKDDGTYQAGHLRLALNFVTDWSIAVDGGAHVGTWSRLLSEAFARVIAVEPSVDTFEALCANMRRFNCQNVELVNEAIGATVGKIQMILDGPQAIRKNTGGRYVRPGGEIPIRPLDAYALPTLGFLKLDIEGSEPAALEGARETIARCRPIICFENKKLCKRYDRKGNASQAILESYGYRLFAPAGADEIWGPA